MDYAAFQARIHELGVDLLDTVQRLVLTRAKPTCVCKPQPWNAPRALSLLDPAGGNVNVRHPAHGRAGTAYK